MTTLFFIGRIIFGLYWLRQAYNHIFHVSSLIGYTQAKSGIKSVGMAKFAIVGTGVLLAVGGLSILLGVWVRLGMLCLIIFLLGVSFMMHAYWKETDPMTKMGEEIGFWKDIALLAALLIMLAIPLPWAYSL